MELSKFTGSKSNIVWEMKQLAAQYNAIDLTVGFTDFSCPNQLVESAHKFIRNGFNNFAPTEGLPGLRAQISELAKNSHGKLYNPETEITITSGMVQSVSAVISTCIKENDEVIIFEPSYPTYNPTVKMFGGTPVNVALKLPDFHIDWEEVRKMVTGKTRMIILNSPHNPTGKVLSEEDLLQLQKLTNGTNIIVLSDELFEFLSYDNKRHLSVARFEKLAARSFIISSFGPVFNINGWNLSWCMAPENLMHEFRRTHRFQVFNVNAPLQYALSEYLDTDIRFSEITEFYQGKRNYFNRIMADSPFKLIPTQGTYFQLIDFSGISNDSDIEFAWKLTVDGQVGTVPVSAFFNLKKNTSLLRVCFAKKNEVLEQAAEKLTNLPFKF